MKTKTSRCNADILKLWSLGQNIRSISEKVGANRNYISKVLRESGIDTSVKSSSENTLYKGVPRDVFPLGCEVSEYFVGFILADGCIHNNRLVIELQSADSDILHKLVDHIGMDVNVRESNKKCGTPVASLGIRSERLCSELGRFGIAPQKTGTEVCPDGLTGSTAFWRGVVDGDGCITIPKNNTPRIYLCGTQKLCQQFLDFCRTIDPEIKSEVRKTKNIYRVVITGRRAMKVMERLYSKSTNHLDRKYTKYEESKKFYQERDGKQEGS